MHSLRRFFFGHLLLILLGLANLTSASASGQFFAVQADVQIEKLVLRNGAAAPVSTEKGLISQVTFIFQPDVEMAEPPGLLVGGRGWNRALIRTTFSAPLNLSFEAGLVTQSDGLLSIIHDPLGNRDYSLRAKLQSDGPAISDQSGQQYRAVQFVFMQRGHDDQTVSLRQLIGKVPDLPDARLLVKYRTIRGSESWHTAANHPTISTVFGLSNFRLIENVAKDDASH